MFKQFDDYMHRGDEQAKEKNAIRQAAFREGKKAHKHEMEEVTAKHAKELSLVPQSYEEQIKEERNHCTGLRKAHEEALALQKANFQHVLDLRTQTHEQAIIAWKQRVVTLEGEIERLQDALHAARMERNALVRNATSGNTFNNCVPAAQQYNNCAVDRKRPREEESSERHV